ncbi:MAG: TRAP transporter small permease [Betaproteobacteria bacterium]
MSASKYLAPRLKAVQRAYEIACGAVLVLFTALVLYSVVMRYMFNNPPMWGEDVPKLLFVWLCFVGGALAYILGYNIRMMSLVDRFPKPLATAIELVTRGITVAMLGTIVWYSVPILELSSDKTVLSTGFSDIWTYLPLTIGAVLMACNEAVRMALAVTGHSPASEDSSTHSGM